MSDCGRQAMLAVQRRRSSRDAATTIDLATATASSSSDDPTKAKGKLDLGRMRGRSAEAVELRREYDRLLEERLSDFGAGRTWTSLSQLLVQTAETVGIHLGAGIHWAFSQAGTVLSPKGLIRLLKGFFRGVVAGLGSSGPFLAPSEEDVFKDLEDTGAGVLSLLD